MGSLFKFLPWVIFFFITDNMYGELTDTRYGDKQAAWIEISK